MKIATAILCAAALALPAAAQTDELRFVSGLNVYKEMRRMLPEWLREQAGAKLAERARTVAAIRTPAELEARRKFIRERFVSILGGFPERTPLNARTVAVLERDGYRVEKVIFESQPRFYVTASLYVPTTGTPPYPAVLYPLGHEAGAKAHSAWQQMLGSLAKKGYIAFAWDPLGQGERVQFWDADLKTSKLRSSTTEHSMLAAQTLLAGDHIARYTIWDGMRALDYLLSRKETDPRRVAVTGNSGGGTHSSYLAALEDRLHVAVPSCYTNDWRNMLKALGPQDGEQVPAGFIGAGLDYPDYILSFGTKPFLVIAGIRDFFPIDGARAAYAEAKRVFEAVGAGEKIAFFETDEGHGYTKPRRLRAYDFLGTWLKGAGDQSPEPDVQTFEEAELFCTPTGQVVTSIGGEDVFSLNRKRVEQAKAARPKLDAAGLRAAARRLSGYEQPQGPLEVKQYGALPRNGYRIEKLVYQSEPGILVPALLYVPEGGAAKKPAVIAADGAGKSAAAADYAEYARHGTVVLSIDARGWGEGVEAAPVRSRLDYPVLFGDYDSAQTAILLGRTLTGMRAADIVRGVDLLLSRPEVDGGAVSGHGRGAGATAMLYAAAFDSRITKLALEGMLASYESVTANRMHFGLWEQVVPGVLKSFDLPELAASLAPRPVTVIDAADPVGNTLPAEEARKLYGAGVRVEHRRVAPR
jgi:cephalosporin-C deacetylase-like acetyl esterase